ncbi:Hypothetical predicted protein [Olea europaea subsp. europaea]|uniref:Hpc2-related domain-containing protein n=1 Tax=Olea europaea subsp. europaea TaxID=158383 RepID=A0A8S0RFH2_OLEEU|nr:Hypothetical predicted protein [Olea europaea subsp. europaea]
MAEGGGEPESGHGSKPKATYESFGGRLRFTVELKPGETTIVSWKKLLKDAAAGKIKGSGPLPGPSTEVHNTVPAPVPALPSGAPTLKQSGENGAKDSQAQPGSNRLSNVIERIERMYAGDGSSDEEDVVLDDVPDDDEYDTEDSFIDDTELDDYFQVDNSAIKHDGFFVNRGKLERIEPASLPNQQPKKRRRKDMAKGPGDNVDGPNPSEHVKIGNKGKKAASMMERNSTSESHKVPVPNVRSEDVQFQDLTNAAEVSIKKKTADTKTASGPSELSNGDGISQEKYIDQQRTGVVSSKNHGNKSKEGYELLDTSTQMSNDKSLYSSKTLSGMPVNSSDEVSQSIQRKEKGGVLENPDLNGPASGSSLQTVAPVPQRKEGSTVRPKSTMLDKAIRELEKTVAESRPPSLEVQDADNPSQAVKRRLTPEIKQKLAKVARLAQASHGKISKDVTNRLMSIVGHLMQLRTLKRNLKIMATIGLSAKQEKDDRVHHIKQEIAEMVKVRIPLVKPKLLEQQTASSDDFQETGPEEKESLKRKYRIDSALEDKICDLYDLYVERFEEDPGPPVRRLYEELAALWPSGMDTHGIKRAICRAKDRKRALSSQQKDQEKMKKKKKLAPKVDEPVRGEASNIALPSHVQEILEPNSRDYNLSSNSKSVPSTAVANAQIRMPATFANGPNMDKPKQEKAKGHSSNPVDVGTTDLLSKKKLKRKQETSFVEGFRPEKSASVQVEERHKHNKQVVTAIPVKSNLQPAAPSSVQPS